MNTSSLKSFAPAVRNQLMEAVGRKLDYVLSADTPDLRQAADQVASLRKEEGRNRASLIERVAYTWFNRLAALRFLDAQGWHPFQARVLTAATPEETQPEILKLLRTGSLPAELHSYTDLQRLNDLLDGRLPTAIAGADPQGEAYRGLILAVCRLYHTLLPNVFDKLNDESELLLPDDLLTATSVAEGFRTEITDADCIEIDASGKSRANVEILGWLYQFYISEKKDAVMARKSAVPTEDIPAVTQLFTPHWIVRYLVENSLGRLWLNSRPNSRLRDQMPYFVADAPEVPSDQSSVISEKSSAVSSTAPTDLFSSSDHGSRLTDHLPLTVAKPEDIRLIDPACGSAHMLTYAFDLLVLIYEEEGYAPNDIPGLILKHNLNGTEICPRAAQLAELALVFKAREKSRRFFSPGKLIRPNIIELHDVSFPENELRDYISAVKLGNIFQHNILKLLHQFEEAKNFGSLIQPCLEEPAILEVRRIVTEYWSRIADPSSSLFLRETHRKVLRVLEQAEALTQRYHVVVANPPYMGAAAMNPRLKNFVETEFEIGRGDTYAAFLLRNTSLALPNGCIGMVTIPNWMFITSFVELRRKLLATAAIQSLIHCGRGVWGSDFGSCAFVLGLSVTGRRGYFKRLFRVQGEVQSNQEIEQNFFDTKEFPLYAITTSELLKIPGCPIAYWLSSRAIENFAIGQPLSQMAEGRSGMSSCNSELFLRQWHEVSNKQIGFLTMSHDEAARSGKKWFHYNKGGGGRKWSGYNNVLINWANDGGDIKRFVVSNPRDPDTNHWSRRLFNLEYFFRPGITWSAVTSARFAARLISDCGVIPGTGSKTLYEVVDKQQRFEVLAFLNSIVSTYYLRALSPTLNFEAGDVGKLPVLTLDATSQLQLIVATEDIWKLSRADWDNFETSWDFRDQPLMRPGLKGATLEASWRNWEAQSTTAIRRMQELETENNRLFIAAYGLDGELQPEVPEAQITLARADQRKDIAAFLSYALGCMMGRFSLSAPGLILANAGDTLEDYVRIVAEKTVASDQSSVISEEVMNFAADDDAIIPVLDGEWFEDDIVARTREFLRATFGEATLKQNLRFIEDALGKSLDKYFLTDFYKDHLQTYKKRPIYWLFQSPKKGFSALVYVHRYTKDTVNTLLNKYLRDYLHKLENRIAYLTQQEATATVTKEKTAARKEREKLQKDLKDCQDWERNTILPLAQQRLEIDLDDGVKVNYLKFEGAVQPIPGLAAKED